MTPATLHILLALAGERRHGYAILTEARAQSGGEFRLGPATLYRTLAALVEKGWIAECAGPTARRRTAEEDDHRRLYYEITPQGRAALLTEVDRMEQTVRRVRALRPTWRKN